MNYGGYKMFRGKHRYCAASRKSPLRGFSLCG
jgi:hypothetical protein